MQRPKSQVRLPRLNEPAPAFKALTTHGEKTLEDYRGKWLILFSHPADFTPVCTTEFIAFANHAGDFQVLNCELLGLSIDSHYAHIAWMRNIKDKFGVDIPFPIIADLSMAVAHAYGMIQPGASDTSAVRATFVIDPEGILRAMVYYPMTNGRSVDEFYRLVQALQMSDEQKGGDTGSLEAWRGCHRSAACHPRSRQYARGRGLRLYGLVFFEEKRVNKTGFRVNPRPMRWSGCRRCQSD